MPERFRGTSSPVLAIVVPCFNEQEVLPMTIRHLAGVLDNLKTQGQVAAGSYLYFVDDGSTDLTWPILIAARTENDSVRSLKLSRNFGHQNALLAGLMQVRPHCDVSISIDADLQQDSGAIRDFWPATPRGQRLSMGYGEIAMPMVSSSARPPHSSIG